MHRRLFIAAGVTSATTLGAPVLALSRRSIAEMTDGPFYPHKSWRAQWTDWDADLTRVQGRDSGPAKGEHLALGLQVHDSDGRIVDAVEVEIWQCDALANYRHPDVRQVPTQFDPGFQGFGVAQGDAQGRLRFRTIRPVPYPGRTPHIHVKLRHPTFGELTSQLFVEGDAGNARDFLWRRLEPQDQAALAMRLVPADGDLRWQTQHRLIVPA